MEQKGGIAVVFWGPHSVCTERFARNLHAPCYLIHYLSWKRPWIAPFKYPPMWLKTWWVLYQQRPSAVLVINTPVFAPLCVYLYCFVARIPFAMNVHGHTLSGRKWGWSRPLQHFLAKKAVVNLVGTTTYMQTFQSWGARTLFLEDPPLEIPQEFYNNTKFGDKYNITVVSTFAGDEPLDLVLESAQRLPEVLFFILGDTRLVKKEFIQQAPHNIVFPGYLKGDDYWMQLLSSHAVMTLTTNPYSLVAGGLEGMYVGKPLILSRQPALIDYFIKGTVFIDHTVESMVAGIQQVQENEFTLTRESSELAAEKRARWESAFREFVKILGVSLE
jgi:glycosyltransferase involved in cell wall biosynthesis